MSDGGRSVIDRAFSWFFGLLAVVSLGLAVYTLTLGMYGTALGAFFGACFWVLFSGMASDRGPLG